MILGMSLPVFTLLHVVISLVGIAAGFVVAFGWTCNRRLEGWTKLFLITTLLTSLTGFLFPFKQIGPPHIFGVISLLLFIPCLLGLYVYKLAGSWRWIYIVSALLLLYLNAFVGVVQSFLKIGFLNALAPAGNEPPFAIAQGLLLVLVVVIGVRALRRFRSASA